MSAPRHPRAGRYRQQGLSAGVKTFADLEQRIGALPDDQAKGDAFAVSEKRDIAVDDAFPHRPITKINRREMNIGFKCRRIEMVNKHADREAAHPRAVPCVHLVDLLMGGISQCYDRTRSDEAALEIEDILREPLAELQRNAFSPTCYKRFQVAWFPREPIDFRSIGRTTSPGILLHARLTRRPCSNRLHVRIRFSLTTGTATARRTRWLDRQPEV